MSFFPVGFNPRADVVYSFPLVDVETDDGSFGFIPGRDGIFTDVNGKKWYGSALIDLPDLGLSINGTAPTGQISMSFFQDPDAPDLIGQIRELGLEVIEGRPLTIYIQPMNGPEEMYAPVFPPVAVMTRTMRSLSNTADGEVQRSITVTFESPFEDRKTARRRILNTQGHAEILGAPNPSLEFMPTNDFQEQKLFG